MTVSFVPASTAPVEPASSDATAASTGSGALDTGFASVLAGVSDRGAARDSSRPSANDTPTRPSDHTTSDKTARHEAANTSPSNEKPANEKPANEKPANEKPGDSTSSDSGPGSSDGAKSSPPGDTSSPSDPAKATGAEPDAVTAALLAALAAAAPAGTLPTANVSTANVSTANVSTANVSTANVSTANVSTANSSTANEAAPGPPATAGTLPLPQSAVVAPATAPVPPGPALATAPGPTATPSGSAVTAEPNAGKLAATASAASEAATTAGAIVSAPSLGATPTSPTPTPGRPATTPAAPSPSFGSSDALTIAPDAGPASGTSMQANRSEPATKNGVAVDNAMLAAAGAAVDRAPSPEAPTAAAAPAAPAASPPPPPVDQLAAVIRPLQRSADGNYQLRIEMRPEELGRVDMRVELRDGVLHASIHTEHTQTAELVRNTLGELRSKLAADGLRSGQLTVDSQGPGTPQRGHQTDIPERLDDPITGVGPTTTVVTPSTPSDSLLDVRI